MSECLIDKVKTMNKPTTSTFSLHSRRTLKSIARAYGISGMKRRRYFSLFILLGTVTFNTSYAQSPDISLLQAPVGTGQCVDSEPFGDGFGWNGVCSCLIEPVSGFGSAISIDNDTAVIGTEQSPDGCVGSGSVFIYEFSQGEWVIRDELVSSGRVENDRFPVKVSISDDSIVANTSRFFRQAPAIFTIFNRTNGNWSESQQIQIDDSPDHFSHDAETLVLATDAGQINGRLLVYSKQPDGIWTVSAEIIHNGAPNIFEVKDDTLVVGTTNTNMLSIYRNIAGSWELQQEFILAEAAIRRPFIGSLDISSDTIVYTPPQGNPIYPSAYTFERQGDASWTQTSGVVVPEIVGLVEYFPDTYLSTVGNLMLYMRDGFVTNPEFGDLFIGGLDPDLFLFRFVDNQWRFSDMTTFAREAGFSLETGFSAAFDGTNMLLGTRSGNTVLALSVDSTGAIIADSSSTIDNDIDPGGVAETGNGSGFDPENPVDGNNTGPDDTTVDPADDNNTGTDDPVNDNNPVTDDTTVDPVDDNNIGTDDTTADLVDDNNTDSGNTNVETTGTEENPDSGGGSISSVFLFLVLPTIRLIRRRKHT